MSYYFFKRRGDFRVPFSERNDGLFYAECQHYKLGAQYNTVGIFNGKRSDMTRARVRFNARNNKPTRLLK